MRVFAQAGEFTADGFTPAKRVFSQGESDVIFNMNYSADITFDSVAVMLADITGKVTTAADVQAEYQRRL